MGITDPQFNLHVKGEVRAKNITNGSSRECKENITDLSTQEALETLHDLTLVTFHYKAEKEKDRCLWQNGRNGSDLSDFQSLS
jgi:hypothetical protein